MNRKSGSVQKLRPASDVLSLDELLARPLDITGSKRFTGLSKLLDTLSEKILTVARSKIRTNKEIARALDLSKSAVSQRLKRLRLSQRQMFRANQEIRGFALQSEEITQKPSVMEV